MTRPADFRAVVRRGRRVSTLPAVVHVLNTGSASDAAAPSRFGFIVTKAVGGAVTRNTVKRRLRSVSRDLLSTIPEGHDVVIRALPGSEQVPWVTLHAEIARGLERGVKG